MATTRDDTELLPVPGLENDEAGTVAVREELKLLQTVHVALEHARPSTPPPESVGEEDRRLLDLREQIAAAKPEDLPSLLDQMHQLGALRASRGKSVVGVIDRASPYFGHLRLEETVRLPGRPQPIQRRRDVLVGGKSYVDAAAGVRIVDWRAAPVSRLYYRYREGDDFEETLGDQLVEGHVVARRSVAIRNGELVRVACPGGTFLRDAAGQWRRIEAKTSRLWTGAGAPAPKLGIGADGELRTDKLLPAIAAMLDKEQFDLITRPGAGVIAIQGSAGSGKTTVGLHRVAYLATSEPARFRSDRMLVVVPNEALIHYTSRVLPQLGVEGVPVTTFDRWAVRVLMDLFPRLPSRHHEETPPLVGRAKGSGAMLRALDAHAADVAARVERRLGELAQRWPEGQRLVDAFRKTKGAPDKRLVDLTRWAEGKRVVEGLDSGGLPQVTRGAVPAIVGELRGLTRDVLGAWDELLTDRARLGRVLEKSFRPGQIDQIHEWCVRSQRVRTEGERDGDAPSIDSEDVPLLLRFWQVLRGPLVDADGTPVKVAHLFVDEVQDASPVDLRVLLEVATDERRGASVTLAGDVAQRMLEDDDERGEADWRQLLTDLGVNVEGGEVEPLKVSYRSTAEITAFARGVLGPFAHEAEPIADRHGPPVEVFNYGSTGEAVAFLADALKQLFSDEPDANVAVLARFPQQAEVYFEGLSRAEVPNVRRVAKQDFTWERGVDVTDIRQTKGLEFDEVVLVETTHSSFADNAQARHALYVGATRAAHQLWCVSSEEPSKLVAEGLAAMAAATTDAS